jgi:23S rRNA pseudoU1915 N3-methylase RlmH
VKILCPSKAKEPYKSVIDELAKRARVNVELVRKIPDGEYAVLDEKGEELTVEKLRKILKPNSVFLVGGPDGVNAPGLRYSLGKFTMNHQIAIIVLLELIFRAKNPTHPYNLH